MSYAAYAAFPGLNWSTLKLLATSPLLVEYRAEHPEPDKAAWIIGRAVHCAVLEPERWPGAYTVSPVFSGKGMRAAKAGWLESLPPGTETLDAGQHALCETIRDAVRGHRAAAKLLAVGRAEVTAAWEVGGVAAKGRLDWLMPTGIVDLKTTRKQSLREFAADASRLLYHGQVAWYHDGAVAAGMLPKDADPPIIIAAQTVEPYDVAALRVSGVELEAGRRVYRKLLEKYTQCQAAKYWPGVAPDVTELVLPGWAPGMGFEEEEEW